jgi:hypothetical protein
MIPLCFFQSWHPPSLGLANQAVCAWRSTSSNYKLEPLTADRHDDQPAYIHVFLAPYRASSYSTNDDDDDDGFASKKLEPHLSQWRVRLRDEWETVFEYYRNFVWTSRVLDAKLILT